MGIKEGEYAGIAPSPVLRRKHRLHSIYGYKVNSAAGHAVDIPS